MDNFKYTNFGTDIYVLIESMLFELQEILYQHCCANDSNTPNLTFNLQHNNKLINRFIAHLMRKY